MRDTTLADALERIRNRRRHKRCPDCDGVVSISGFDGEYRWTCLDCESVGIGYGTRTAARADLRRRRRR